MLQYATPLRISLRKMLTMDLCWMHAFVLDVLLPGAKGAVLQFFFYSFLDGFCSTL